MVVDNVINPSSLCFSCFYAELFFGGITMSNADLLPSLT